MVSVLVPGGAAGTGDGVPPSVGLVVSKSVGGSVVRTRVKRRLRHLMAVRIDALPAGTEVVLRALPPAASAGSTELGADLDRCLRSLVTAERVGG